MSHSQHHQSSQPAQPQRHLHTPSAGVRRTLFAAVTIFSTAVHLVVPVVSAGQPLAPALADAVLGAPKKASAAALPDTSTGLSSNQFLTTVQPEENMVVNGSFEMGATALAQTKIPGWSVASGTVDVFNGYFNPDGSTYEVDLDGTPGPGTITQTITGLAGGQSYIFEFDYATNGNTSEQAIVNASDSSNTVILNQTFTSPGDPNNKGWQPFRQTFTAPADGIVTLSFQGLNTNGNNTLGMMIDDVRVARRMINYIQNGSFDNGPVQTNATANIPAWTVTAGNIDIYNAYFRPDGSTRYLYVNGNTPGTIEQTVSGLTASQKYYLDFEYASEGNVSTQATVKLLDSSAATILTQTVTSPGDANNRGWQHFRASFTAPADGVAKLQFAGLTAGNNGFTVDNVRIADQPLNWVSNGDFEAGPTALNIANNAVPGWTVVTGPTDVFQPGLLYGKAIDLRGSPSSAKLEQTITGLTAGQVYVFQANFASNGNSNKWGFIRLFDSGGATLLDQRVACDHDISYQGWCSLRYSFAAPADGTVKVQLADDSTVGGAANLGIIVDNVSISRDVNFVANGSFSSGPTGLNQPFVPSWSTVDTPDIVDGQGGSQYRYGVDLKGSPASVSIKQNLSGLTPNATYVLRYHYFANADGYDAAFTTQVTSVGGGTLISTTTNTGLNATPANKGMREARMTFTAPADGNVSIIFRDVTDPANGYYGAFIDNVSVYGTASVAGVLQIACASSAQSNITTAPGGVTDGLRFWTRADKGTYNNTNGTVAAAGDPIYRWNDQSGYSLDMVPTTSRAPTYRAGTPQSNFNPFIDFAGDYLVNYSQILPVYSDVSMFAVGNKTTNTGISTIFSTGDNANDPTLDVTNLDFNPWSDASSPAYVTHLGSPVTQGKPYLFDMRARNGVNNDLIAGLSGYDHANGMEILGDSDLYMFRKANIGSDGGGENWAGGVTENILYSRALTGTELARVRSYLAIRNGLTVDITPTLDAASQNYDYLDSSGASIWTGNSTNVGYHKNVAGIGRDDASALDQRQANSVYNGFQPVLGLGNIAATNAANGNAFGADRSFLMWGSNSAAATFGTVFTPTTYTPPAGYFRMNRVWKVQKSGTVGVVEVQGPSTANLLLVSTDPTFATGVTEVALTNSKGTFTFASGQYFTFGAEATAPGGVNSGLQAWVMADAGTSTTSEGGAVSAWADQTQYHYDFTQATSTYQPLYYGTTSGKLVNYNPTLDFDGVDDHLRNTTTLMPSSSAYTFMAVGVDDGADLAYRKLFGSEAIVDYFGLYRQGGAPGDNGWIPYAIGGQARSAPFIGDRGSMGKGTKYSVAGGPNGYWNGANFTSDSRTDHAQPQIVGFNSLNSATTDPFYTWTDGYKEDPNWSPIVDGLVYRNQFFSQASIGADVNVELWKGRIPEFMAYSQSLNDTQIRQINTYLAIKYGITLGQGNGAVYNNAGNYDYLATDGTTVIWNATANSTYGYNIAGIGRDDAEGLTQLQSTSVNGSQGITVTMGLGEIALTNLANTGVFTANKSYLVWGDNNGAVALTSSYNGGTNNRITRRWKVQETGAVGMVKVRIPATIVGLQTLLVNTSNAFGTIDREYPLTLAGGYYEADVDFRNNDFFTFSTNPVSTANLNIGKSGPATATQNTNYDYTLVVTNTGVVASSGQISVTDNLPTGLNFVGASGFACSAAGQLVTCLSNAAIAPNASVNITLTVNPTATGTMNNSASVIGGGDTTSAGSNSVSTVVNPPPADLQIGKSGPLTATQNTNYNYTLVVTNTGGSASSGTITVTDALPAGLGFVSGSGSGFTCSASGQNVTCTSSTAIAVSGMATITLAVNPTVTGTVSNTAGVIGGGDLTSASSNSVNTTVSAAAASDLTTTIGQPSPAFVAGSASNVPVTVTNNGTGPTTGPITTTFTLPSGTSAPASFSSNGNICTTTGQTVTCVNPGPINNGSSNTIQVPVTPDNTTIGTQPQFNATTATPGETNAGNNAASPMTPSSAVAAGASPYDLTTTIGQPSPAFVAGQSSNVPVTVTNTGTGPTTGPITTTFTLPSGASAPASFSSNGNTCTTSGQTVTCVNAGPIPAGSSNTIQVPVTPNANSAGTTPAPFNASSATPGETNTGNNAASPMTPSSPVASGADLTTTIGQPSPAFVAGSASNVPVTVTNTGTGPTTGPITTTFTLPTGTSTPASFNSNGNTCTRSGQTVTCVNPGPIAAGSSNTIQVPVTPDNTTIGTQPQFNATSATPGETNTGNNAASPMTPSSAVVAGASPYDLTTAVGQPSPALVVGASSNVPVTVTNAGTGPTTGPITTTFTLPTGTSAPASFTSNGNTCTTSGQIVTCVNPGPIAAGSSNTIQVPVTPNAGTVGASPQFNATTATPGETNTGNNAATPMTPSAPVVNGADLTTTIGQPSPRFTEGQPSNVPVTVTNNGTGPTTGPITTTFTLPTGTSAPASFSSNGNTCTTSGQTVTCVNPGPIAAGSSNTIQVPVTPNNGTVGTTPAPFQASATTTGESNTGNNSATPMTPSQSVLSGDTTPPAPPVIVAPTAGSSINDNTPIISGTVEAGALVTVTEGASTLCVVVADGSGNWSCSPSSNLSDGSHTVNAVARDAAGNVSSPASTRTFTVDTVAPNTPTVTAPAASSTVSDTTPTFSGTAEAGSTVTVKEGATTLCTAVANGSGNWSCDAATPLSDGLHVALVTATDPAGNTSTTPATRAFTVDSTAPSAPAINAPPANATISNTTPTLSGTAEAGSTVTVKDGPTTVCTTVADGAGNWSCTSSALAAGPHSLTATATDPAGNTGAASAPRALTVDNTAPTAPTLIAPAANATLGASTVPVSGVAEPNSTVTVRDGAGGPVVCTTTADSSGNFSCTTSALNNGPHTLAVDARDAAGNTGPTATRPITVSNAGPAITAPAANAIVTTTTPLFTGVGVPNSTVVVKEGSTTLCTTLSDASGNWACAATAPLSQGAHSVTASVTDSGNNTQTSPAVSFNVDTVAPASPVVSTPAANGSTNDSTPTVSGTAEAGSTVRVTDNGNPVCTAVADAGGNWSCDATAPLSEGPHTLSVTATDPAGNTSPATTRPFSVDTLPPAAPAVTAPTLNSLLNTATPVVTGNAEPNATVVVKDGPGGPTVCTTTANASGVFSCPLSTPLSQGPHTLSVNAVDVAGNAGPNVTLPVTVDSVAPSAPAMTQPANGAVLSNQSPTIAGTAEPNTAITVKDGPTTVCTTTANAGGTWSCPPNTPLSNGAHALTATASDVAGNTSPASTPVGITINTSGNNDDDGDGISNLIECPGLTNCPDTDGDGVPNHLDSDSDNDGVLDQVEGLHDTDGDGVPNRLESNRADTDGDGIPNQQDADDDGDGIPTAQEDINHDGNFQNDDADHDGIPAYLDPNDAAQQANGGDSDGDGISDKVECPAGLSGKPCPDTDGDGVPDYRDADSDNDGLSDQQEGAADADGDGVPNRLESRKADTDGDGIPNQNDIDDDGDGILTASEDLNSDGDWRNDDADKDGIPAYLDPNDAQQLPNGGDGDNDGISDKLECPLAAVGGRCPDTDGDGVPDYLDLDSDNDGIADRAEGTTDSDGDGLPNRLESNRADTDGDGVPNQQDADDDGDGIPTAQEDLNNDGNFLNDDADKDGIPAYLDKNDPSPVQPNGGDSDGDGLSDKLECPSGLTGSPCPDTDGDGVPDYRDADSDGDGTPDAQEGTADNDGDGIPNRLESSKADTDGDGIPNQQDADDDGDGIPTANEDLNGDGNFLNDDADRDGIPAYLDSNDHQQGVGDADNDGISDKVECIVGPVCPDTDGDGRPDYADPDSDGDGVLDAAEGIADSDGDGLPDRLESNRADTDGDGILNPADADDDGDGIPTKQEDLNGDGNWQNDDADKDGIPAYLDPNDAQKLANGGDSDGDNIPDKEECNSAGSNRCVDTDGDGRPDYMDKDSDGDGTSDADEGRTDTDDDGIPNRLESSKADTDGDGRPNQQDADDDGDGIPTAQEDLNNDGNFLNDDADKDGIPAYLDSNDDKPNQVDGGDSDNDGISDKAECPTGPACPDTDGDGLPDYRDTDSDGDGQTDLREGTKDDDGDGLPNRLEPNNTDTDGDGIPNNKDADDDGDGVPTALEDLNGDGNWMDDDPNGNGVPAYLDRGEPSLTPTVTPAIGVPSSGGRSPINGIAPAGSTVTVREGNRVVCTTTANAQGAWSCDAPLGLGAHLLTASVTDGSGTTRTSSPAMVMIGRAVYAPIVIKR